MRAPNPYGAVQAEARKLMEEIEVAFADVEADFPDCEPGWEHDVIRSVLQMSDASEAAKAEVRRMHDVDQGDRWD